MYSVRIPLRLRRLAYPSLLSHPSAGHRAQIPSSRRCLHKLLDWPYEIENGLGEFLSPAALRMIAVDYQQGLLTRLNEQVKGTEMEGQSVAQTVISAANHRRHALAFNYASQALNNSFFLQYLMPPPTPPATNESSMGSFLQEIRLNFGSLEQLKSTFSAAAMGMVNSGWVWLVSDENGMMQVVATFGAGTLLVRSRRHMLEDDQTPILGEVPLAVSKPSIETSTPPPPSHPPQMSPSATSPTSGLHNQGSGLLSPTPSHAFHTSSLTSQPDLYSRPNIYQEASPHSAISGKSPSFNDMGDILTPLLCVSVHEHAWVGGGYGVWGKEEYLKRFWTVVNWGSVAQAYTKAVQYA